MTEAAGRALVVLPSAPLERDAVDRAIRGLGYLPRPPLAVDLAAPDDRLERYKREHSERAVSPYRAGSSERGYDAVCYMAGTEPPPAVLRREPAPRVYRWTPLGLERAGPADEFDYPHFSTHVFNRLGPRTGSFRFFPYVFTELRTGHGPTNEYGHRIAVDLGSLRDRPRDHTVIAVFGNSSTAAVFCQHHEMFTALLEERLAEATGRRFTVLNFGMTAAPVLYESISYLIFCESVRPDVVIAHDGFVDLVSGQINDPYLLNELHLTYYNPLERWAQLVHGTDAEPFTWPRTGGPRPLGDHPRAIVTAYIRRRRQFARIVRAHGAAFVAGLQPLLFSKSGASPYEAAWPERHPGVGHGIQRPLFDDVEPLYRVLLRVNGGDDDVLFANVHEHFARFGPEVTLFEDMVHTVPAGERAIADYYDAFLRSRVLPTLGARPAIT